MDKYKALKINGKRIDEHRYLIQLALGRPLESNEIVHHKDGNKSNNDLSNLEVLQRSEHSRMHTKERFKNAEAVEQQREKAKNNAALVYKKNVLNRDQVAEIKSLKGTMTQVEIAKRFNVARCTINRILNHRAWSHN